jgi:hypothetical protein
MKAKAFSKSQDVIHGFDYLKTQNSKVFLANMSVLVFVGPTFSGPYYKTMANLLFVF